MPSKNNEVNEQEQQLVLFETGNGNQGQEPEAHEQKPEENAVPGTGTLNSYFKRLGNFENSITNFDSIMNYTQIVSHSLKRGAKDPEAAKLQKDFEEFTKRVKNISNDASIELVTAVNKTGDRSVTVNAEENKKKLTELLNEFSGFSKRLETFMRSKPENPAVSVILRRTGNIIGDEAPIAGRGNDPHSENGSFEVANGPHKEARQAFFDIYSEYLSEMVNVSKNTVILKRDDRSTPEQRLRHNLKSIQNVNGNYNADSIFYIDLKDFPLPEKGKALEKLGTPEGRNSYLKEIDQFFVSNHVSLDEDKLKSLTKHVKKDKSRINQINMQGEYLNDVSKVIDNPDLGWDAKKMYLRSVCSAGFRDGFLSNKLNVENYLSDYKADGKTPKTDEEKIKSAKKWLSEVGNFIAFNNNYDNKRKDYVVMTHAMFKAGSDILENMPRITKTLEAAKKIVNGEVQTGMRMRDLTVILEKLNDLKEKPLEGGMIRPSAHGLLDQIENATETYFKAMEASSPKMTWSKDEIQTIGAAIDLVSAFKPEEKEKLCVRMNLKVNAKGEYSIGGDIPLVANSFSQMEETKKAVLDADPRLMKSSPEYKAMRAATEALQKKTAELMKYRKTEGKLSDEQIMDLLSMAEEADKSAHEYTKYKINDLGNKAPNKIEMRRINAAELVSATADDIKKYIRDLTLNNTRLKGPKAALDAVEKQVCRRQTPTAEDLASMVYLETVRNDMEKNPDTFSVGKALSHKKMQNCVNSILKNEDFKKIIKDMPKDLKGAEAKNYVYGEMKKAANKEVKKEEKIEKKTEGLKLGGI